MTRLRRRPRAVYRICSEDEYLAGADPFADGDAPAAGEAKHGRTLQRFAGAAAITGAVGAVGGVVGLVGLHGRSSQRREIAERLVPSVPIASPRRGASTAHAAHVAHRHVVHRSRPRRGHTQGTARVQVALAPTRRVQARPAVAIPVRASAASDPQSAPVASVAQSAPAAASARPRAQSEFGFER